MKIQAIPMPHGDAFIVKYKGNSGKEHVLLLDMGTQRAYEQSIKSQLSQVGSVDLCVLSHNHEDHIGGALKYTHDANEGMDVVLVKKWWFNAARVPTAQKKLDAPEISIHQANEIAEYLSARYDDEHWKSKVQVGDPIEYDGLRIYVLSPKEAKPCNGQPYPEDDGVEIPIGVGEYDYHIPIDQFEINNFIEDTKEEHESCISLLLEYHGKRFLWMSDAYPSTVAQTLCQMGYNEDSPLECEYMTLSHHGSRGNTSMELMSLVRCKKYIVTGNGMNKYRLPNKETLARVIRSQGEDVEFFTTQLSLPLQRIFDVDGKYRIEEKRGFEV